MEKKGHRARGLARLAALCLPVAAALALPSVAAGAAAGGSTVRATVGGDGSVQSVKVYAPGGGVSSFNGQLPIKVSISRTVSGSTSTYTYHVENTYSKTQTVSWKDPAGKTHTATTDLQLPLVAQLGVQLPKTFRDVSAPQGVVETGPDGVNRVLFQLVLFSPLGSPTQDVTFTATGSGAPSMEMSAVAVNPSTTAGLSQSGQDSNASAQQDDFWAGFANGGNGGLTQLADGMGKLVAGLQQATPGAHQLADGLKAAGDGANKLDAGTTDAYNGSKKLLAGTKQADSGAGELATGSKEASTGANQLQTGAKSAYTGSQQLATGSKQAADGATALSAGVAQISAGLAQLDAQTPAAVDGLTKIEAGVKQILAGLEGSPGTATSPGMADATTPSVLLGLTATAAQVPPTGGVQSSMAFAIASLQADLAALQAIPAADLGLLPPADQTVIGNVITDLATQAIAAGIAPAPLDKGGVLVQTKAGIDEITAALQQITLGLDHPANPATSDPGGVDQGLLALLDPTTGLPAAVAGIHQLALGAASASTGSQQLAAGTGQVATGAAALSAGVGQISGGLDQLAPGVAKIAGGNADLASGLDQIAAGMGSLVSGLGQLAAGQHQVATGLPAAVTGAGELASGMDQITSGAVQVDAGIKAVQSGAVAPLLKQLTDGSQNAKKQLAILDAATALGAEAPGGQGTTYVLSQSKYGFRLAAATTSSSGSSDTGRNVGIGLGGLAVLVLGTLAGFALGRRSSRAAV